MALLEARETGLYCPAGDFHIDPALPVDRAVITHAQADHARPGSRAYLTARPGEALLRARLGDDAAIQSEPYGASIRIGEVSVSFHPAGHILGSAQVRIERAGEIWVVSGDYKLAPDPTCAPFEPLRCHTFVTESTFGLPIFRWPDGPRRPLAEIKPGGAPINDQTGKTSVLFAYAAGQGAARAVRPRPRRRPASSFTHGRRNAYNAIYRAQGIALPLPAETSDLLAAALILAPPTARARPGYAGSAPPPPAFASGWMRIRGPRRRRSLDRGFVLSDHADWPALLRAIEEIRRRDRLGDSRLPRPLVRWLQEQGTPRRPRGVDLAHRLRRADTARPGGRTE